MNRPEIRHESFDLVEFSSFNGDPTGSLSCRETQNLKPGSKDSQENPVLIPNPMHAIPQGFRLAAVASGVKRSSNKLDLCLFVSDLPAAAAGVYTRNLVFAAPVGFDRGRTPGEGFRVVVVNSGNANACTGERGDADAAQMAMLAAKAIGAQEGQALVMSTGVIGQFLPMNKIEAGVLAAAKELASDERAIENVSRGLMTTDSVPKIASRRLHLASREIRILGFAKGAAMIGPNMATMLGLIVTDAPVAAADAQRSLTKAADGTFNCISVEGHMSTNDTVLLMANGAAKGAPLEGDDLKSFDSGLFEVCEDLARSIPADGEGCDHLVTIRVTGCADEPGARKIAKTVAESALVKTAIAGADPNWGRIVSAAGYSGVPFDPTKVGLKLNGFVMYRDGAPVSHDEKAVSDTLRERRETEIDLSFGEGTASVRFWTTDLTAEYVRLNADYRT